MYEEPESSSCEALVYAEDFSSNGTYLNGACMGKRQGFLVSDNDIIRVSPRFAFRLKAFDQYELSAPLDGLQEKESQVRPPCMLHDDTNDRQHFRGEFKISPRQLGSGSYGYVRMAYNISSTCNTQYACKIIDLRKFKTARTALFGRWEVPQRAMAVDQVAQRRKVQHLINQSRADLRLKKVRIQSQREAEILKDLDHVCQPQTETYSDVDQLRAEHYRI